MSVVKSILGFEELMGALCFGMLKQQQCHRHHWNLVGVAEVMSDMHGCLGLQGSLAFSVLLLLDSNGMMIAHYPQ